MRIVQVAAEFAPLIKAGGLGEVLIGLSRQLVKRNQEVDVIIPKYDTLPLHLLQDLKIEIPDFSIFEEQTEISNTMWSAQFENIRIHLLETKHPANYFNRGNIYGFADDAPRFLYFAKATAAYLNLKQTPIDILQLHDWHTAALAAMMKGNKLIKKTILNIHNLEYQGKCGINDLKQAGIKRELIDSFHNNDHHHPDSYNILRGGLALVDQIVAVSPSYAREILTPEYGWGLNPLLNKRKATLSGILNGIDQILWNPATDPYLNKQYNKTDSVDSIKAAKKQNQDFLRDKFGLKGAPWVGAITRIVPQKGPEFIEAAIQQTVDAGGAFILLGSSPIPELQRHFEAIKTKFERCPQVLIQLNFDEDLAHKLYASLDFLLLPSHFEPCGLAQMIGMHYGTIPIARKTGGLKDTVFETEDKEKWNGFTFTHANIDEFSACLNRAIKTNERSKIMQNGLQTDFSWETPTSQYIELYKNLLQNSR